MRYPLRSHGTIAGPVNGGNGSNDHNVEQQDSTMDMDLGTEQQDSTMNVDLGTGQQDSTMNVDLGTGQLPEAPVEQQDSTMNEDLGSELSSIDEQDSRMDENSGTDRLPKPFFEVFKASLLVEMINENDLDLSPEYQRDVVWTDKAKGSFISSLLMNVCSPMIYLNEVIPRSGEGPEDAVYVCVDGKQRLTSLQEFLNGDIPCNHQGQRLWSFDNSTEPANADGRRARKVIMPDEMKTQLEDIVFVCAIYPQLSRAQEIKLFQRLQFGKPLTVAERFRAQEGRWETLVKRFEIDYRLVVGLIRLSRGNGFRVILQSFMQIVECRSCTADGKEPVAKFSDTAIKSFCANEDSLTDEIRTHLRAVFFDFTRLAQVDDSPLVNMSLRGTQTFAPVEFVAIACLISKRRAHIPLPRMIERIKQLRSFLRIHHKDLRMNAAVWNTAWEDIDKL